MCNGAERLAPQGTIIEVVERQERADAAGDDQQMLRIDGESAEAQRILGAPSAEIANRLGYPGEPEIIHRDNLVVASRQ